MKPDVTRRHTSPFAIVARDSSPLRWIASVASPLAVAPPAASETSATATLIPRSAYVTTGAPGAARKLRTGVLSRAHSGHRMPTGVVVMQSVQIGRPHEEQETAVSRLGCR